MIDRKDHLKAFVGLAHALQVRKYTGEPYMFHLSSVAKMADEYGLEFGYEIGLCHDLLEDTAVSKDELHSFLLRVGYLNGEADFIVNGVVELTDVYTHEDYPGFNRKYRKVFECQRMATISENSQSIKYCDLIDNTKSIVEHDEGFAKIYLKEKFNLLQVIDRGNNDLYNLALKNCI